MTKKIIISLAVVVAVAFGFLYGKGLLSVHQGLEPPASLAVLKLEKAPKAAPSVTFADAAGGSHALTRSGAAMCFEPLGHLVRALRQ